MGKITSLFVRKITETADDRVDKKALLRSVGIEEDSPIDPAHMVTDTDYYDFLERLAAVDGNASTIPLRTGAVMGCDDYGAFGLAWKSALNLRGSYERAERYARVLTSVAAYEVEPTNKGAFINLHRSGDRRLGMRLSNEATIASIASLSRQVSTGEFKPIAVYFKHSAPKSIVDHELYFECPTYFDSDRDALLVSSKTLQTPNKQGDDSISKFFDTHLQAQLENFEDNNPLDKQVRMEISHSLSEGVPMVSDVAQRLYMSGRTLQRKLSEQGYSYQTLVDESRRQLAERLLRQSDYSLADVAFLTGFSEQSAFTRAFKRWEGQTPRSFRIKVQSKLR
jgi:AraC-like DNA-binding protein